MYRIQVGSWALPNAARYSDAAGHVRRGNGESAAAGAAANGGSGRRTAGMK